MFRDGVTPWVTTRVQNRARVRRRHGIVRLKISLISSGKLDLLGAAEIEVLADHLFKEQAAVHGAVKHLCGRELRLQDREVIAVAGLAVGRCEGMRQQPQPFAQQGIDPGGGEAVADRLQTLGLGAAENAIVERFESNAFLRKLAVGISWPFRHSLELNGNELQNLRKNGPKSRTTAEM